MRINNQAGQNTVEYLLMLSVAVGVVLGAGAAIKHFMPAFAGKVTGQITSAVCTLASEKLDMCSHADDSAGSSGESSGGAKSAASAAAAAAGSFASSISGGAASAGSAGGGGTAGSPANISAPMPGGGPAGSPSGSIDNVPGGGGSSGGGTASAPSIGNGGFVNSPSAGNAPAGGGGAPLSASAGAGEAGSASVAKGGASSASAEKTGAAPGSTASGGAAGAGSAGGRAGAGSGAAGGGSSADGASGLPVSPGLPDIVEKATKLTAEALAGKPEAPGELSKLWRRLKPGDYQPPSDQKKQQAFEAELSADEKLREAYLKWDALNYKDRKEALQRTSDDFSKAYGIDSVALVLKDDPAKDAPAGMPVISTNLNDKDAAFGEVVHQSVHRMQDDLIGQFNRGGIAPSDERYMQAVLLNLNGAVYFAAAKGYDAYRSQPLEAHAYRFEGSTRYLKGPQPALGVNKDPLGDQLRALIGGGDMNAAKKKAGIVFGMGLAFALFVGAGLFLILKEQQVGGGGGSSGAGASGARRVEVSVRDEVPAGMKAEVHHVGDIAIGTGGELKLSIFNEGKAANALREAFEGLKKQSTLKLLVEEVKEENGRQVKASSWVDVRSDDPRFVWAVVTLLKHDHGFECEVI